MKKPGIKLQLLEQILSQPTAPFRETHVQNVLKEVFLKHKLPFFEDPTGNIILGAGSKADYLRKIRRRTKEPLRVFISHMDHPGFHGTKWISPKKMRVKWHGGTPTKFLNGSSVWLANQEGWATEGKLSNVKMWKNGAAIDSADVVFKKTDVRKTYPNAKSLYGGFRFRKPVWRKNQIVYTKAADDLVGVFSIVSAYLSLPKARRENFIGLLTRAEEVGYIGTLKHFNLKWLQTKNRKVVCIVLETSRTLPKAIIGKGPVIRLGDRTTIFDASTTNVLKHVAATRLKNRHQVRIMDGGTCEGTAAMTYGFPTIGISVPLGNYHNQSFEGGPDSRGFRGPGPEFVHLSDIQGMIQLCLGLAERGLPWESPWKAVHQRLSKNLKKYQPLLRS